MIILIHQDNAARGNEYTSNRGKTGSIRRWRDLSGEEPCGGHSPTNEMPAWGGRGAGGGGFVCHYNYMWVKPYVCIVPDWPMNIHI